MASEEVLQSESKQINEANKSQEKADKLKKLFKKIHVLTISFLIVGFIFFLILGYLDIPEQTSKASEAIISLIAVLYGTSVLISLSTIMISSIILIVIHKHDSEFTKKYFPSTIALTGIYPLLNIFYFIITDLLMWDGPVDISMLFSRIWNEDGFKFYFFLFIFFSAAALALRLAFYYQEHKKHYFIMI